MRWKKVTRLVICLMCNFCLILCATEEITYNLVEESTPNSYVGQISHDGSLKTKYNSTILSQFRYSLLKPDSPGTNLFKIDDYSSIIRTKKAVDRDTLCSLLQKCCGTSECSITLNIIIYPVQYLTFINAKVNIKDINDNIPKFPKTEVSVQIPESSPINTTFPLPTATDADAGVNGVKSYILDSSNQGTFALDTRKNEGVITDLYLRNLKVLDREEIGSYKLVVYAQDGGSPQRTGALVVNIIVTDANDNTPIFVNNSYSVRIPESTKINKSIIRVHATDSDSGLNGQISFAISSRASSDITSKFGIDPVSGWVHVIGALDYEAKSSYKIPVGASDKGSGSRTSHTTVNVYLQDVNDNAPVISVNALNSGGKVLVSEAAPLGFFVALVQVSDKDEGENANISCTVIDDFFSLIPFSADRPNEYKLVTQARLDREKTQFHRINLTCYDHGVPSLKSTKSVLITVTDTNDSPPAFHKKSYSVAIAENNELGDYLLTVNASDPDADENGAVRYKMGTDGESVAVVVGGKLYANKVFDFETQNKYTFSVIAYDAGKNSLSSSVSVTVSILDLNDNRPKFVDVEKLNITENVSSGSYVGKVRAVDGDGENNSKLTYYLKPSSDSAKFSMSSVGIIRTKAILDREKQQSYSLIAIVKDNGRPSLTASTTVIIDVIDVNDNTPVIYFPSQNNNTVYISYLEPVGYVFVRVNAFDRDNVLNSKLIYTFVKSDIGLFDINSETGEISVARTMTVSDAYPYTMRINVTDSGAIPRSAFALITIKIDKSGKPISLTGQYLDKDTKNNFVILLVTSILSAIAVLVLVVAIIIVCRRHDWSGSLCTPPCTTAPPKPGEWPVTKIEAQKKALCTNSSNYDKIKIIDPRKKGSPNGHVIIPIAGTTITSSKGDVETVVQEKNAKNYEHTNRQTKDPGYVNKAFTLNEHKVQFERDGVRLQSDSDSEASTQHSGDSGRGASIEDVNYMLQQRSDVPTLILAPPYPPKNQGGPRQQHFQPRAENIYHQKSNSDCDAPKSILKKPAHNQNQRPASVMEQPVSWVCQPPPQRRHLPGGANPAFMPIKFVKVHGDQPEVSGMSYEARV